MNAEHRGDGITAIRQRGTLLIGLCVWCSSLLLATPAAAPGRGYPVQVYFSKHPASDENPAAVFPVRRLSPTRAVATFAIGSGSSWSAPPAPKSEAAITRPWPASSTVPPPVDARPFGSCSTGGGRVWSRGPRRCSSAALR